MKVLRISTAVLLALAWATSTVDAGELMQVQVSFGTDYSNALGQAASAQAKEAAELRLAQDLGDKIKYFDFVRANAQAGHTLAFRIDHPTSTQAGGERTNLYDYYVFLTLDGKGGPHDGWLFRDAASNLSGAESPESIADTLSKQAIDNREQIIAFLQTVSFTSEATFMSDIRGWRINRSRLALCMKEETEIKVHSTVPGAPIEDDFEAEVKRAPAFDLQSTLSKVKQNQDISQLEAHPEQAQVLAVYVLKYQQECPVAPKSPSATSFAGGTP